ncbi:MAG: NAD kinase [Bordetella sp.]|nr:MAG: NAD kinase [Bordetella sp.]
MNFSTVALIGRYRDTGLNTPLEKLVNLLIKANRQVLIESETAYNTGLCNYPIASLKQIGDYASLAIVIGGDGTVLSTARYLAPYGVPLLGINHGRLGFITDIPICDMTNAINWIIEGNYQIEERILLKSTVWRDNEKIHSALSLNDVVLNRSSRGGMIEIEIEYNNTFMYTQRADGLIIATPTGSTAYALASNGPILHPTLNAILLVPVAPQTLSNRPIIIPENGILKMKLTEIGRDTGANVHFDTQTLSNLQLGDQITVERSKYKTRFVHPDGYSFFSTLRKKLHWNIMPKSSDCKF